MTQSFFEVARALRLFVRAGKGDGAEVLPGILADLSSLCRAPGADPRDACAGECASLLSGILRTLRDAALLTRVLQALLALGRFGRSLALPHIQARILPLPQFTAILLALPGRELLGLVNEMLLPPPGEDKQYLAWAKTLLPTQNRCDPREALAFLGTLLDEGTPLARPLRDAILAACMADALPQAFASKPGPSTAEALLKADEMLAAPAIHAEALGYALRSAGAGGPSRLGPLLAAPLALPVRESALAAEMGRLAGLPEAPTLLLASARAEPELLGVVLADMLRQGGAARAAALRLSPLLPQHGLERLLADCPAPDRHPVLAQVFRALVRHDPDFVRRAAKALQGTLDKAALHALADMLTAHNAATEAENTALLAPAASQAEPPAKAANNSRRAPLAEALKDALVPLKDQDYSQSVLARETLDGAALSSVLLAGSRFSSVVFRKVRLTGCAMQGSRFEDCTFKGCVFSGVDLCDAVFQDCRFEGCVFERCDAARASFSSCVLAGCAVAESTFASVSLAKARLDRLAVRLSAFCGLRAHESALTACSFSRSDLTGAALVRTILRHGEWADCTLARASLRHCEAQDLSFVRCSLPGMTALCGHTDNPHLARAARLALVADLSGPLAGAAELPPQLRTGPGAAFVAACVGRHARVAEARRTLAAVRAQNQRRLDLALARLSEQQGVFLRLLPQLLATDAFEKVHGLKDVPPCDLGGVFRVDSALLERFFPGQPHKAHSPPVLTIEALYAIGSLGSVAQKPSSDIDCWVCHTIPASGEQQARDGLRRKLAALEAWAAQQFGLEVHFFAMTLDEVRANAFGMSDKESSGSAQAALLKEEFYRTAFKLGGRDLAWWAAPPGADAAGVQSLLAEIAVLDPRLSDELVDLGQPEAIPPGEYFGACLWQMVKALHSPYKSVMKLALLEKYADRGQTMRLLCDRIKEAVLRGRTRPEWTDPYLALFASVHKHYAALDDQASLGLLAECLRLKADVEPEDLPPEFAQLATGAVESGTFASSMRLGGLVSQFMIAAYRRIQGGIKANRAAASITPEDMTRLGRRIAANFSQHEHKVGLVPFLSDDVAFTELFFYAEKAPGKRTVWAVKGKEKATGKAAVESLAPIRRDTDVARLLAWVLANGIYEPGRAVQAEKSLAPIAVMDVQALLTDLTAFFPRREILEPDMEEYLQNERVTRAYMILNLPVPPEKNKVLMASVIYATNWGELFCQSFENPAPLLNISPLTFLRESLAKPVPPRPEFKIFIPKKSACPRVKAV